MSFNMIFTRLGIKSLKGRLRLSFISLVLLLVILGTIPLYIVGKQERFDLALKEIEKVINVQQIVVNNWLEEKMMDLKTLASLPSFKEEDEKWMEQALRVYGDHYQEYSAIIFANEDGITEMASSGDIDVDISNREYFIESKKGNDFISDVIIGKVTNKPIITISTPVYSTNNEFIGIIFGTVPIGNINFIMEQFQDKSRETYLVDKKGMLITESRQGNIGEYIDTKAYASALENKKLNNFYEVNSGDFVLGDYRWVANERWIIIGEIKRDEIVSSLIKMSVVFVIELIILIFVGWLLISWLIKQIREPVNRVLLGTKKIGEGQWGYRLENENNYYEASEFQQLSSNFNKMGQLIEDNILSLAKSEERFRMIAEYSSDIITIHDTKGTYLYVSPAGKEVLGYDDDEIVGQINGDFIHEDDVENIEVKINCFKKSGYEVFTYRMRHKDGSYVWLESSAKRLVGNGAEETRIFVISRNITERKEAEDKLKEANTLLKDLSMKDGLLGIWNRRAFDQHIEVEWNRSLRNGRPISALMIDIDYFKSYNDTYGHQLGDDCLKKVADTLKETLKRAGDVVFRYGGEEFSIILSNTNETGALIVANNIKNAIEQLAIPHKNSKAANIVTVSIGVNTVTPKKEIAYTALIKGADKALYEAKETGRNKITVYQD